MQQLRNQDKKLKKLNVESEIRDLAALQIGLAKRIFDLEKEMRQASAMAIAISKAADYRCLAIMEVLEDQGVPKETFIEKANKVMTKDFWNQSDIEDRNKGLIAVDAPAEKSHHAIFNCKFFKGKNMEELPDDELPISKIELGKGELFPEIDDAIVGMRPGEIKTFDVCLQGKTDQATVTLFGLRKIEEDAVGKKKSEVDNGNTEIS